MAKGRRLTTSRSERFLGSYSYGHGQGDAFSGDSELREEDVWSMADNGADQSESNESWNFETRDGRRRIPRGGGGGGDHHVGGLSFAFEDSSSTKRGIVHQYRISHDTVTPAEEAPRGRQMATSAPLNVPDWSKIYRVDSVDSMHDSDDDGGESEMMPPHEYLAREYARSKKSGGASVCEGVGRTLKGRDMRRVRDAVWSQTGFYG